MQKQDNSVIQVVLARRGPVIHKACKVALIDICICQKKHPVLVQHGLNKITGSDPRLDAHIRVVKSVDTDNTAAQNSNKYIDINNCDISSLIITLIDNYIINVFKKDFPNLANNDNLYMSFIRYYSKNLDNVKNTFLLSINVNEDMLYKLNNQSILSYISNHIFNLFTLL